MTTRRPSIAILASAALFMLCACGDESSPKPEPSKVSEPAPQPSSQGSTAPAKAPAGTPPAPKPAAPKLSPLKMMLQGKAPEEVKLIKGHGSTWSHKYPGGWASSPGNSLLFMVMKRSADAAMLCEGGNTPFLEELHVTPGLTKNLAKRAPVKGKDLQAVGADEFVEIGGQKIKARAGHMKGNVFGAPDGDLYWWDFRMKRKEGLPYHVSCLAALKAGAEQKTERELQAVIRSIRIPPDNVLDPVHPPKKK